MKVFITGIAGFIGYHTAMAYKELGWEVHGVDNYNDFYDPDLKDYRSSLMWEKGINLAEIDIRSKDMTSYMMEVKPDLVIHLAAHAGIRQSMDDPIEYIDNNIHGTQCLINSCELVGVENVIYASTSSVMTGSNGQMLNENSSTANQRSPYGYTKLTNENQFHCSKIKNAVGLRFFTVYGPWGRPDMALYKFVQNALSGDPITVYNGGKMLRDFTYIDDVVQGIVLVSENMTERDIYCVGSGRCVNLLDFIDKIEQTISVKAKREYADAHPADALTTWADITKISNLGNFKYNPKTTIDEGIEKFVEWYKSYHWK